MSLKIDQDHSRFRNIVRGRIRQNLRKYISQGEMIGRKGRTSCPIPIPQIDIPRFRFGDKQQGGTGQGDGEPGDPVGGEQGDEQEGGKKAGEGPGDHVLEVDVTLDELAAILGEELELPDIQDKGKSKIINEKDRYTGIRRVGPESLRHFSRTYREALKRQISHRDATRRSKPVVVPVPDDKRYRSWKTEAEPVANAVIIYMMDVSGSMGDEQKEIVRIESFWIDAWLQQPVQGAREPLHHPRRRRARGRPRDVLPHPGERRHDDLERLQALQPAHRRPLPARGVEHLPVPLLRRRQLVDGRHAARASTC